MIPILCSFHYFRRTDMGALQAQYGNRLDIFADSGAFSALNAGAQITVPDYCDWLSQNAPHLNFAAALDVIGDYKATRTNADAMQEAVGDKVVIVPTFHVGSPWKELDALVRDYKFIALGGAVAVSRRQKPITQWLAQAMRVCRDNGAVAHGFGLTREPFPAVLPFYSVDSSYWKYGKMGGKVELWDEPRRTFVSVTGGKRLTVDQARVARDYGFDVQRLQTKGYGLVGKTENKNLAQNEYRFMGKAGAMSVIKRQKYLNAIKPPVPAPDRVQGDGLKMYLACSPNQDIEYVVEAYDHVHGRVAA